MPTGLISPAICVRFPTPRVTCGSLTSPASPTSTQIDEARMTLPTANQQATRIIARTATAFISHLAEQCSWTIQVGSKSNRPTLTMPTILANLLLPNQLAGGTDL